MANPNELSPAIELVSYDMWLTLLDYKDSTFVDERNELLRQEFARSMSNSEFNTVVSQQDKVADDIAESRDKDMFFDERVCLIAGAVASPTPTDTTLERLYRQQGELFLQHSPVLIDEASVGYLAELARERKVALVSNTGFVHGEQIRPVLGNLGILSVFSNVLFSNEVGVAKPHPDIFRQLLADSETDATHAVHIGDNPIADYDGALAAGMNAILVKKRPSVIDVHNQLVNIG